MYMSMLYLYILYKHIAIIIEYIHLYIARLDAAGIHSENPLELAIT